MIINRTLNMRLRCRVEKLAMSRLPRRSRRLKELGMKERRNTTFGWDHYTYINQIFGDDDVRKILEEVYPNCEYRLAKKLHCEFGYHHFVEEIKTGKKIDSMSSGLQLSDDIKDTLCQSYSIWARMYPRDPLTKDKKQKQLDMINMYRKLLRNKVFVEQINNKILLDKLERRRWKINDDTNRNINMNIESLIKKINGVLDDWEEFGYSYFIGSGQ